jgi:DNA mismatch repair protein MutS
MLFDIDKQTIRDLNLFEERANVKSIFSVYNRASTKGGHEMLNRLFRAPVSDLEFLQYRKDEINFFFLNKLSLKLKPRQFDFIEHYLVNDRVPLRNNIVDAAYNGLMNKLSADGDYWIITNGIFYVIRLLVDLEYFLTEVESLNLPLSLEADFTRIRSFINLNIIKNSLSDPPEDLTSF